MELNHDEENKRVREKIEWPKLSGRKVAANEGGCEKREKFFEQELLLGWVDESLRKIVKEHEGFCVIEWTVITG
jgi:hypothetical protein